MKKTIVKILLMVSVPVLVEAQKLTNAVIDQNGQLVVTASKTSSVTDFDFFEGKWNIHHRKLKSRLSHSTEWMEYDGMNEDRKILNGTAHNNTNIAWVDGVLNESLSLTLFNPKTKLWSIYFANSKDGVFNEHHPVVGSFEGNIGTFYAKDVHDNKQILVKAQWDKTNPDKAIWSQAFSEDNGKTWEWNWYMTQTKVKEQPDDWKKLPPFTPSAEMPKLKFDDNGEIVMTPSATSSSHDFDFLPGNWVMYNSKLKSRLDNCTEWFQFESTSENTGSMLNGLGNRDFYRMNLNNQPFEGLTIRLFDPKTRLWSLYWVASDVGVLDPPVVGSFEGSIGYFFCKDTFKGKPIIVVFKWDKTDPKNPVWAQAFSPDNGVTWEWNATNVSHRVK